MVLNIDYDGDIAQTVEDLPGSFTWEGDAYAAIVDPIVEQQEVEGMEGYRLIKNFIIVVQTSLFTSSRPEIADTITISGKDYRLDSVIADEADAGLNIHAVGLTQ